MFLSERLFTRDPEPRVTVDHLLPMTWYEFRVAAINTNCTGPNGAMSDPILTRAAPKGELLGGPGLAHHDPTEELLWSDWSAQSRPRASRCDCTS